MRESLTTRDARDPIRILGGGLAGLSLGIGLRRRGVAVEVGEAGRYPRHRVCGEFLSGLCAESLRSLGIGHLLDGAVACHATTWFRGDREVMRRELPEPARGISRNLLDARLADEFRRLGGVLLEGVRQSPSGDEGEVVAIGRRRAPGDWVGLKMHFEGLELISDLEMHLGDNCYFGLSRIENGRVNACGLFRGAPGHSRNLAGACRERGLGELARRMTRAVADPDSFCSVAGLRFGWQFSRGRSGGGASVRGAGAGMCLGDRLAVIPPFAGNGMAMAIEGAELALGPVADYVAGGLSWREACDLVDKAAAGRFRCRLFAAGMLQPLLVGRAGQRLVAGMAELPGFPFPTFYRLVRP